VNRVEPLDYGRFLAAITVLAYHYLVNGIYNGKIDSLAPEPALVGFAKYGYLGVEFFFMISGYVIFFSARGKRASEFVVSRALRLYPAFWVAMLCTAAVAVFLGDGRMDVTPAQVLVNLTMFSRALGVPFVDGVYWTLQFELAFYLAVLALLLAGLQDRLEPIFLLWPFAMAVALALGLSELPYLGGHFPFFAAGAVLAIQKTRPTRYSLAALLLCCALCVLFAVRNLPAGLVADGVSYSRPLIAAIVCAQFAFFLFLNSRLGSRLRLPGSRLAGGLTYPLYLVHAHIGYMLLSRFATEDNKALVYPAVVAAVLALACAIHFGIERRGAAFWRGAIDTSLGRATRWLERRLAGVPGLVARLRRAA